MSFHGRAPQRVQQAMQAMVPVPRQPSNYIPSDPWAGSYRTGYQEINRETAPSTAGNSPVNGGQRALQPGAIDVASLPPRGANFSPQEMANWLISQKLGTQAAVIGGGVVGVGALSTGINAMQDDSNGALGLGAMAQAGLLGGVGAIGGHDGVAMYQRQHERTAKGFDQPASASRDARHGRHRAYGAMIGTAAGALAGLTSQLNDRLQTEQY